MQVGERFRSSGARSIARFLASHQDCDAGIDVAREDEPGSGKLRITCKGCGGSIEYRAGEVAPLPSGLLVSSENGEPWGPPPTPQGEPEAGEPGPAASPTAGRLGVPREGMPRPLARPGRRLSVSGWLTALLVLAGAALILIGVLDDGGGTTADRPAGADEARPSPGDRAGGAGADAQGNPPPAVERRGVPGLFSVAVPRGWDRTTREGAVVFDAPGGRAELRAFLESGERPLPELARGAAAFLAGEHPGARLTGPGSVRMGGAPARRLVARYDGGREVAAVVATGGYSYLLLSRVDSTAPAKLSRAAARALRSFRVG
jgi:hypothetical protein